MKRALIGAACALLVLFAGCVRTGGEGEDQVIASPPPSPEPTPCVLEDASAKAQSSEGDREFSPVSDVRQNEEGCPRVVFEFRDEEPGFRVEYADEPFEECGSGERVETADWDAEAFIRVRLEPSSSVDLQSNDGDEFEQTYDGPRDISADGPILKHLRVICDFEAVYEWVIGLDSKRDFLVTHYDDPARLVIDIQS